MPASEAEAALRRLATTFAGEVTDAPALADTLRQPPLTLLADALALMPAPEAVRLVLGADLADLDRRVRAAAWLGAPETPLHSRKELGHAPVRGPPRRPGAPGADRAAEPPVPGLTLVVPPARATIPHPPSRLVRAVRRAVLAPPAGRAAVHLLADPRRDGNRGGEMRAYEQEKADLLAGLSADEVLRVEADRERLLGLKVRLLGRLSQALAAGEVGALRADITALLSESLTAPDVGFYAGIDGRVPPGGGWATRRPPPTRGHPADFPTDWRWPVRSNRS